MWENDEEFIEWLNVENLATEQNPLDDETLELMFQAFQAGYDLASFER